MWENKKEDEESEPDHGESKEISASAVISGSDDLGDSTGGITITPKETDELVDMVTNLIVKRVRATVNNEDWIADVHNWVYSNLNTGVEKMAYSDISLLVGETELNALRDTLL